MTDHSTARALVEELSQFVDNPAYDINMVRGVMRRARDFIEQTLTPPEGDTLSAKDVDAICDEAVKLAKHADPGGRIEWRAAYHGAMLARAALQSRVSPTDEINEDLVEQCVEATFKQFAIERGTIPDPYEAARICIRITRQAFRVSPQEGLREALEYASYTAKRSDRSNSFKVVCIAKRADAALSASRKRHP